MILGVTMGDASGVGPEIVLKAFRDREIRYSIVVFGDLAPLDYANRRLGFSVPLRVVADVRDLQDDCLNLVDLGLLKMEDLQPGKISRMSGAAARAYVVTATQAALRREIAAIVTLPMNKEATQLSDSAFTGHTELIAELCGAQNVTIMLASDQLIVTHVSTHCSLQTAIERVKKDRIQRIIQSTVEAVTRLKPGARVAVAGLNPHAGEHGLFGSEEIDQIQPAVDWAKAQGMPVEGPVPPDTVFYLAVARKRYDAVVCMYHDQGHIPLKLLDFDGGVNVTVGLPIIRTSVDHGTAFDIAYQGVASTKSFIKAMEFAVRLIGGETKC